VILFRPRPLYQVWKLWRREELCLVVARNRNLSRTPRRQKVNAGTGVRPRSTLDVWSIRGNATTMTSRRQWTQQRDICRSDHTSVKLLNACTSLKRICCLLQIPWTKTASLRTSVHLQTLTAAHVVDKLSGHLWNPKAQHRFQMNLALDLIHSQLHPLHILPPVSLR
jgi:hypothetical protein